MELSDTKLEGMAVAKRKKSKRNKTVPNRDPERNIVTAFLADELMNQMRDYLARVDVLTIPPSKHSIGIGSPQFVDFLATAIEHMSKIIMILLRSFNCGKLSLYTNRSDL
jgi:hypothetical protein